MTTRHIKSKIQRAKRKVIRRIHNQPKSLTGFIIKGAVFDAFTVVRTFCKFVNVPIHAISHEIHKELRYHPKYVWVFGPRAISIYVGVGIVVLTFVAEGISHHYAYHALIETGRAAGVAPLGECIAELFVNLKNIEKS